MKKFFIVVISIIVIILILVFSFKFGYNIVKGNSNTEKTEEVSSNLNIESNNTVKEENIVEKMDEEEAEKLLMECYQNASECYKFSSYNVSDKEQTLEYKGQYVSAYEIYDFKEILEKNFTENEINNMIKNFPLLIMQNDKYYFELGSVAEEYDNASFKNIQIENNKIIATMVADIYVGEECVEEAVESEFVIVKVNDKWLVDSYKNVNENK